MRLASSPASPVTAERIAVVKAAAIRDTSGGTLELMPTRASFAADVAGLPAVRLALADAQRAGRTTLQILLSGPAVRLAAQTDLVFDRLTEREGLASNNVTCMVQDRSR